MSTITSSNKTTTGGAATTPESLIRERASTILSNLDTKHDEHDDDDDDVDTNTTTMKKKYTSWVRGEVDIEKLEGFIPSERCKYFDRNGFLVMRKFADPNTEVPAMKHQMEELTEGWDPTRKTATFRTDEEQVVAQGSDDYFLDSASRVHFFAEEDAMDDNNNLREQYQNDKMAALNKAGHGMHTIPRTPFHTYATSTKVRSLVKELGYIDPIIPQSMYIFKQPHIGGVVTSHQDSTFLFTTPRQTCLGLWLALDDATINNGCLWVRPKSHKEGVRRQFVRNVAHFGNNGKDMEGDRSEPQMIFETVDPNNLQSIPWEGKLPENITNSPTLNGLFDVGFVPVECKAGDLVVFPGTLDHLSLANTSSRARHTFQLHLVEGRESGVTWSERNWLQYPKGQTFISIK